MVHYLVVYIRWLYVYVIEPNKKLSDSGLLLYERISYVNLLSMEVEPYTL